VWRYAPANLQYGWSNEDTHTHTHTHTYIYIYIYIYIYKTLWQRQNCSSASEVCGVI
jgi:hypothetical protein